MKTEHVRAPMLSVPVPLVKGRNGRFANLKTKMQRNGMLSWY